MGKKKQELAEAIGADEIQTNKLINKDIEEVIDALTRDQLRASLRSKLLGEGK